MTRTYGCEGAHNTAADHITVIRAALSQLPGHHPGTRPGRKILVRVDGAGATHELLNYLLRQRLSYSIGFSLPDCFAAKLALIPRSAWTPAYNCDGEVRDGAWVAEVTGLLDLRSWPPGMRVIIRKERPRPVEPAPTRATSAALSHPPTRISPQRPTEPGQDHYQPPGERSGLT